MANVNNKKTYAMCLPVLEVGTDLTELSFLEGLWSWSRMFSAGVGVGFQNCLSRFFETAGVGVGFLKLLESELVFQNCWSRNQETESENLLQLPTPMFIK